MARNKIHEQILEQLTLIEERHKVKVLYACESGSRAWGFESADSDYDVRFIYMHEPKWYLSVKEKQRDVIECTHGSLDISGWELRKALNLYRKSNPSLLEWLTSPIQYKTYSAVYKQLLSMLPAYFSQKRAMYHYFHMAKGNYRTYLKGDTVWLKKYLYVLRPLMACIHIKRGLGMPPVDFMELVRVVALLDETVTDIEELVKHKRMGGELAHGPRIDNLSSFIDYVINDLGGDFNDYEDRMNTFDPLNHVFRMALHDVYGHKMQNYWWRYDSYGNMIEV